MAWRIRLSEAIPDTAEKAGWWAMGFGVAATVVALVLNDVPLSVFGFLLAAAGGILPPVVGLKRRGKRPAPLPTTEELGRPALDDLVREIRRRRGEMVTMPEDEAARGRVH